MRKKLIEKYVIGIMIIFGIIMITIPMHFVARNLLFERFGICSPWMRIFLENDTEFIDALAGKSVSIEDDDPAETGPVEVSVSIDWEQQYPFAGQTSVPSQDTAVSAASHGAAVKNVINRYVGLVESLEEKIDYYCTDGLPFYSNAVSAAAQAEKVAGCTSMVGTDDVLQMKNGYLTYTQARLEDGEIEELADEIVDFQNFLEQQGIPFIYANAGSKVCPYDKQLADPSREYTNENGDRLMKRLKQQGINTIDFREEMQADQLDWYDCYYKTDHHWKTEMGLWAADKLAARLNQLDGFSFDRRMFSKEQYTFQTYENCFLGGQGRAVTLAAASPESYTKITPKFKTDFTLQIPTRGLELCGDYEDVLFDNVRLKQILAYTGADYMTQAAAYDCARARNDAVSHIHNLDPPDNVSKKILMLQDSFAWYSTSFLACDIGAVDIIHLPAFTGSIRSYIEQTKPDAVIMMYCERNIKPIDRSGHDSTFDLR